MRISIATVCSVAIFALPSVTAWGVVAHRVIGLIAKQFLTKEGLAYVDAYLHQQSMDSIGSWADDERRSSRKSDAPEYHFTSSMDPSGTQCVYDDHRDCANGICLSSAIARHNKILMESTSPDDPGAEDSMKYLLHYVSDVCQPLHTNGQDEEGSLIRVRFGGKRWSLHTVWDTTILEKRVQDDFQDNPVLYASYLIRSIKTGENKVLSESWTSKLSIDAVNDIGNSMVAIEYTTDSYELSCSVAWAKYNEHRRTNLGGQYYRDVVKTVDMQISKAGLRVAKWFNELASLHSQTKVEAATLLTAQPGKSNIEKHPSSPRESMPQSKKDPSMSSKQLVSGAQKPDYPPPPQSDHDDHQVVGDADTEWQVVKKKGPREQTTINKGIRLFTGARLSTVIGPLLVETGIGSLLTRSLVSRVRLLERSVTKRTPINVICSGTDNDVFTLNVQGQLVRSQRWFWSHRTKQLYRNRYWLTPQVRPKTVKQRHLFALMETLRTCGDSASLQKYVTRQLLDTSGFFKDPSFDQSRAHGTRYLMLARMDALWTARKAIQIGILVDTHPFSIDHCILCNQQLLSTFIAHFVVECEQVTGHRIQSELVPAIQKSRLRLLGRSTRSGCGECIYLAPRWSHKWRSRSGPAVVGRDCGT
ncbi:hypothetical protein BASA50_007226 [Batrachochytrium salamandrivorans]|uniref:Uncharacterized protein n=1 Tax=Batrachochytrium salamandrivorans TaxID=1357716 RepID=A0ABQ8F7Q6_9FUNG|nr:hypothetical protein BASA50_007226 [Batrachochytrium salamandrivorans]